MDSHSNRFSYEAQRISYLSFPPQEDKGQSLMPSYGSHLGEDYAGSGYEVATPTQKPWEAWLKSPTWKAIKRHRLMQEPNCRHCAQEGCSAIATNVGHVDPHRGQWARFIHYENTQSLCARHHKQLKKGCCCGPRMSMLDPVQPHHQAMRPSRRAPLERCDGSPARCSWR